MSELIRCYHGCTVRSRLAEPGAKGDGWTHEVFTKEDVTLGKCDTLAEAIGVAKMQAEISRETLPVAEAATETEGE